MVLPDRRHHSGVGGFRCVGMFLSFGRGLCRIEKHDRVQCLRLIHGMAGRHDDPDDPTRTRPDAAGLAGLVVLITVVVYILSSQVPALASVPGTTYGYACTFAFLLQTPGKLDKVVLTSISLDNVVLVVPLSMAIGALFGLASAKLAAFLTKPNLAVA